MKKPAVVLCLCTILIFGGTFAYTQAKQALDPSPYPAVNTIPGVTFVLDEDSVTPEGLTATLENNSHLELLTGTFYCLEQYRFGSWYRVPEQYHPSWTLVGFLVPIDESLSFPQNWEDLYGSLPAGKYRFIKTAGNFNVQGSESYAFAVPFTIS